MAKPKPNLPKKCNIKPATLGAEPVAKTNVPAPNIRTDKLIKLKNENPKAYWEILQGKELWPKK